MTTHDTVDALMMALADEFASAAAKALVESLYGTSKSYTAECASDRDEARAALRAAIEEALKDAERYRFLRSYYAEEHSYLGVSTTGGSVFGIDADSLVDQEIARATAPPDVQQMEGER